MLNSSHTKKQGAFNLPSRLHMRFSQPQQTGVSHTIRMGFCYPGLHFLFQDKTRNLRSRCSPAHDCEKDRLATNKTKKHKSMHVSEVDLVSFSFHYAPLGRIKIQLTFAFWEPAVPGAVKATSFTAFLKTLSARQTVGQEEKENLICHIGLNFWS